VNDTPVILVKATEAFIAYSSSEKSTIRTRSCSPSSAYIEFSSPPNFLIKLTALSVLSALISFNQENIGLIALDTHEAVTRFNELAEQGENVAAALHLTC
jgi:hypothetical protein